MSQPRGMAGRLAAAFIDSRLTPLIIIAAIALGVLAVVALPREEEPQIIVPMIDVFVQMPGASPAEVEQRVTRPLEKLLWEVPGVEYLYSTSSPGLSMVVVRFYVGQAGRARDRAPEPEDGGQHGPAAARRVASARQAALDRRRAHHGRDAVGRRPRRSPASPARRAAARRDQGGAGRLRGHDDRWTAASGHGGPRSGAARRVRSRPARGAALDRVREHAAAGVRRRGGQHASADRGRCAAARRRIAPHRRGHGARRAPGAAAGRGRRSGRRRRTVHVRHVPLADGRRASGGHDLDLEAQGHQRGRHHPPGRAEARLRCAARWCPSIVHLSVTRNYGETSREKSNELLWHMFLAVLSVSALIWLALGRREAVVVLVAIPVTLALTLFVFYLYGYTLNRITLFALIFSIGILVDDAIVVVENVVRHSRLHPTDRRGFAAIALRAVDEVGNPTILATFTVVAAILPMAFVGGLMGPYMRPIPVGASAAMVFSLLVAFIVTPWAASRLLAHGGAHHHEHQQEDLLTRIYRRVMGPLITNAKVRFAFLGAVALLLLIAVAFVPLGWVKVKMLPFDNKSEFQVIVDMPEGTPLEETARVASALATKALEEPDRHRRADLRRDGVALQLQRARASLLPAPRAASGRPAGQPPRQGRPLGAEPRDRQACADGAAADRETPRGDHPGRRSAARTARAADARGGGLRPGCRAPCRAREAGARHLRADAGRRRRGLVRRGAAAEVASRGRRREELRRPA